MHHATTHILTFGFAPLHPVQTRFQRGTCLQQLARPKPWSNRKHRRTQQIINRLQEQPVSAKSGIVKKILPFPSTNEDFKMCSVTLHNQIIQTWSFPFLQWKPFNMLQKTTLWASSWTQVCALLMLVESLQQLKISPWPCDFAHGASLDNDFSCTCCWKKHSKFVCFGGVHLQVLCDWLKFVQEWLNSLVFL